MKSEMRCGDRWMRSGRRRVRSVVVGERLRIMIVMIVIINNEDSDL